jgi:hypothetical protein
MQETVGRDFTSACDYPGGQASETNLRPIGALSVGCGQQDSAASTGETATCVPTGAGLIFCHATKDAV